MRRRPRWFGPQHYHQNYLQNSEESVQESRRPIKRVTSKGRVNDPSPEGRKLVRVPKDSPIHDIPPSPKNVPSKPPRTSKTSFRRTKRSASVHCLPVRDPNLPISSLPGPPVPPRLLRPYSSCYAGLASIGIVDSLVDRYPY